MIAQNIKNAFEKHAVKVTILNHVRHSYILVHWLTKLCHVIKNKLLFYRNYLKAVDSLFQSVNSLFKRVNDPCDDGEFVNNARATHYWHAVLRESNMLDTMLDTSIFPYGKNCFWNLLTNQWTMNIWTTNMKQIYTAFIRVSELKLWSLGDCNCVPLSKIHCSTIVVTSDP